MRTGRLKPAASRNAWVTPRRARAFGLGREQGPPGNRHRLFKGSDSTRLAGRAAWLLSENDIAAAYRYLEASPLEIVDLADPRRHSLPGAGALSEHDLGELRELHAHQVQYFADVAELGWCVWLSCTT